MAIPRAGWPGALLVVLAAALFGSLGAASRFAYDAGVQPFAFVAWRAGVGALGLLLVILVIARPPAGLGDLAADRPSRTATRCSWRRCWARR